MHNYCFVQFKSLHHLQCMAFTGRDFQGKAQQFSGRVPLRACGRAGEEEVLFKIQGAFGDFCTRETFLDLLLRVRTKVEGLQG